MAAEALISQIKEGYLTCSICMSSFSKPKALPCLHTYCQGCLSDYISSRGYESTRRFPCPICRSDTVIPEMGVPGFPDNHVMASLSDTVDRSAPVRPVPKPRKSMGTAQIQPENHQKPPTSTYQGEEVVDLDPKLRRTDLDVPQIPSAPPSDYGNHENQSVDSRLDDSSSMCMLQRKLPTAPSKWPVLSHVNHSPTQVPTQLVYPHLAGQPPLVVQQPLSPTTCSTGKLFHSTGCDLNTFESGQKPSQENNQPPVYSHGATETSPMFYPSLLTQTQDDDAVCTTNLQLSFGKLGASARDFLKPIGLAVSKDSNYIISDSSGEHNRMFIFNSKGELIKAFNCGCKVRDLTITKECEILVAVHKNGSAIRHFTMAGACKAEYGSSFTFEEPSGIAQLTNGKVVLTGTQNHCVYVLTDKMKLATTFGRKGNGNGYFLYPGYIAVDSKNQIIVTDKLNNYIQIFTVDGKLKLRFGAGGSNHGQLQSPLGVCVDGRDNIIVADSGNNRVEMFSSKGRWLSDVVTNTHRLGDKVKPVNVAVTPSGHVAVLLRGPYFAEVRVYSS